MKKAFLFRSLFLNLLISLLVASGLALGQSSSGSIRSRWLHGYWSARWISCPGISQRAYGVFHFRKTFMLEKVPSHFIVHLTADNRFILYVNGQEVTRGPARGDLYNWSYNTEDLAPFLKPGKNVLAAEVWNMGVYAAVAQISNQTGFLLQGDAAAQQLVNTGSSWKVLHDTAYAPTALEVPGKLHAYMVVGPGDRVDASRYPWGWEQRDYPDSGWMQARVLPTAAVPKGYGSDNIWTLVPRTIPDMEMRLQRLQTVRRTSGIQVPSGFLQGTASLRIPAYSKVRILLDQSFETTAYPVLMCSGGAGSKVRLVYAEALLDSLGRKGNRNRIAGKHILGLYDTFLPDGGKDRRFSPLWFRTYRYLQVEVQTANQPLVLNDLYGMYTGYPFYRKAQFASNDSSLQQIWKVGWRTARLCAGETYFDCPYYEELQYEADTRIQALISLYNTGDDRLMRKAIRDFYLSRVPNGLTQGRYPSNRLQVIPTFSLFWISMLHDYWMLRKDDAFLQTFLDPARRILDWYNEHLDDRTGMLGPMDWWNFVDWNTRFPGGVPDGAATGGSSVLTLQYAYTLKQAADLFAYFGKNRTAEHERALAERLCRATYARCFDSRRMEMANTPQKSAFSQHAGIMALLAGAIPFAQRDQVLRKILTDTSLSQATFYYRFYLTRAMVYCGKADWYYASLSPWRNMLKTGLTTFAENPDPTRSDCHAWSASPVYDFLATLCGIRPSAPGFSTVRIAPAMGALRHIHACMPHPQGLIEVDLQRKGTKGLEARIQLPGTLRGTLVWMGHTVKLHPGIQQISL